MVNPKDPRWINLIEKSSQVLGINNNHHVIILLYTIYNFEINLNAQNPAQMQYFDNMALDFLYGSHKVNRLVCVAV